MARANYRHEDGGAARSIRHTGPAAHGDGRNIPRQSWVHQPLIPRGSGKYPPEMAPKAKKHLPELQLLLSLLISIFLPFPTGWWLGGEVDVWKRQHGPSAPSPCKVWVTQGLGAPEHSSSRCGSPQRRSRHSLASLLQKASLVAQQQQINSLSCFRM